MNVPDDADLETRLARLRPADLPDDFSRRLHAAEPPTLAASKGGWRPAGTALTLRDALAALFRPWPLAYAGLLAIWLLILTLRLATPSPPASPAHPPFLAHGNPEPASLGSFSLDRATLLTRNNLSDPWP